MARWLQLIGAQTNMSERRRMLLAIVNQFKWLPYSYTYLYHSLVPQTISGKNVRTKAKLTKIYGNSEVVNQLNSNGDFSDSDPSAYNVQEPTYEDVSIANNKMTMTLLRNIGSGVVVYLYSNYTFYANHKYLVRAKVKSVVGNNGIRIGFANSQTWEYVEDSINEGQTKIVSGIVYFTSPATFTATYIRMHGALPSGNSIELSEFEVVDLTQAYPFDTPTTLTDNRVKNILAQDYIPYNTGEIKDMVICEFSSNDSNNQPLGTLPLPAPYKSSGIGTSKDSWEITNTSHIFARNNFHYTFTGNESWAQGSSGYNYYATISLGFKKVDGNTIPNALTPVGSFTTYGTITTQTTNNKIAFHPTSDIVAISNDLYANVSSLTGKTIAYQLATPQTITIPRKHLAVVDLGSLTFSYDSVNARFISGSPLSNSAIVSSSANVPQFYCEKYLTIDLNHLSSDMLISQYTNGNIYIKDSRYTNATDFKNAMQGQYLFYETENEVADITDTFDIEAGGTITSDSDVLPNVDFKLKCK